MDFPEISVSGVSVTIGKEQESLMSKHNHNHGNTGGAGGEARSPEATFAAPLRDDARQAAGAGEGTGEAGENVASSGAGNVAGSGASGSAASADGSAKTPGEGGDAKIAALEAELADRQLKFTELEAKSADLNDQYLRKAADFENFRKRMNREKQELTDFANQNLLLDLLPIIDDFERAIKSADTSKDFASFYEGVVMIEKRLSNQLESKWGLKRFDSAGELFDPNLHEAIQMEKKAGITEAVVKEDFVKGYFLREKVLRCAKVLVLMPDENSAAAEPLSPGLDREK